MTKYDHKNGLVHIVKGIPWNQRNAKILYYFKCGRDLIDYAVSPEGVPPTCLQCLSAD
jgi:hypothetical protein